MNSIDDIEVVDTDSRIISACSFCGYKSGGTQGHHRKSEWLKKRYIEGMRFKVLRSREFGEIGMLEYTPGKQSWRPVSAEGYLVIHCLMVNGKHKGRGLGTLLLDSCLKDARDSKCKGVAVVTSSDSFMAERGLFIKSGFVPVESFPPYELLVNKFNDSSPDPAFIVEKEQLLKKCSTGLTIFAADQCPMVPKWVEEIAEASKALGLDPNVVQIENARESRQLPTPYGMFSIIYNGKLIAGRPVSARRFTNIMNKLL